MLSAQVQFSPVGAVAFVLSIVLGFNMVEAGVAAAAAHMVVGEAVFRKIERRVVAAQAM